jgi:hypothetical protein
LFDRGTWSEASRIADILCHRSSGNPPSGRDGIPDIYQSSADRNTTSPRRRLIEGSHDMRPSEFFDDAERAQLSDLLDELGPDAPTLLAPWTTRDIAAHLILRDHDPLAAPGLVLPGAWRRFAE